MAVSLLVAPSAASAEPGYCYNDEPSEGVMVETGKERPDPLMQAMVLVPVLYRSMCGLADDEDRKYVRKFYVSLDCSEGSDLAQGLERGLEPLPLTEDDRTFRERHKTEYDEFCRRIGEIELPEFIDDVQMLLDSPAMGRVTDYDNKVMRKLPRK